MKKLFKSWTREDWLNVLLFCLLAFTVSNGASIRGSCSSSPCSGLDDGFEQEIDYHFASDVLIPAPTAFFAKQIIQHEPDVKINSRQGYFAADADRGETDKERQKNDQKTLTRFFLVYEFFVLLSLPLWFLGAVLLKQMDKHRNRFLSVTGKIVFWGVIVFLVGVCILSALFDEVGGGEPNRTAEFFWAILVRR